MSDNKKQTCLYWNIRSNKINTIEKIFDMAEPDIIFLSEVENPDGKKVNPYLRGKGYECLKWVGDCSYKGLALYAKPGTIAHCYSEGDGQYSIAAHIVDKDACVIGVWTKPPAYKYCKQMQEIFDYYTSKENHPIFVGDFNVSPNVCGQEKKASVLFKNLNDKGYVSLYHQNRNINVGEEVDVTYRHTSGACFMLDYVLISASCVDSVGLTTDFSNSKDLLQLGFSDHIPIIFEV